MTRPMTADAPSKLVAALRRLQRPCELCPRRCRRQRPAGHCREPAALAVATSCSHAGEEPCLAGSAGAGTVFVVGCTMACTFCQNHQISQPRRREEAWSTSPDALADALLQLQDQGCHNIEWVSPTQHLPGLVEALELARRRGLHLPLVFNCNGYQRPEVLRLLEGIVDVYLPDAKYADDALAHRLSGVSDYVAQNRATLREMWRQVGPLQLDDDGLARRGLLIRHLVLPGQLENTRAVLSWIGAELGPRAWVSLMAQYHPVRRPDLPNTSAPRRGLTRREYRLALDALEQAGLERGWVQELGCGRLFLPDFARPDPFAADAGATARRL